jgi:protein LTV1
MGRKKFNKKDAQVYHMVRRSQQDVGGYFDDEGKPIDMPSDFVLIPSEDTLKRAQDKQKSHALEDAASGGASGGAQVGEEVGADDALELARQKLKQANLVDDYDYDKHMAPISGTGVFINANSDTHGNYNSKDVTPDFYTSEIRSKKLDLIDPMIKEVDRQLNSITLTADCMDDDVAQALFGDYEDGEFEEVLDDFCFTADQEEPIHEFTLEEGDEDYDGGDKGNSKGGLMGSFDFNAHIDQLIAKAKLEENGGATVIPQNHNAWTQQQNMFKGVKPLRNKKNRDFDDLDSIDEEDSLIGGVGGPGHPDYFTNEENPGIVPKLNPAEEKALCDKFEQTLLEYDSDELGDLDEECYDIKGDRPLEGDKQIEAALDSFLQDQKDENLIIGSTYDDKRVGGSSRVLINGRLVDYNTYTGTTTTDDANGNQGVEDCIINVNVNIDGSKIEEVLAEADEVLANPEMDLPPEEVLIDGKSYFTMKEHNPWDCESILSTYSNLDNNPAVVGRSGRRRKKKKNKKGMNGIDDFGVESIAEDKPVQILLSNKTGLPLGVLPGPSGFLDDDQQQTFVSVNKGEARKKGETKEEKRARKLLVKQERQISRIEKKMMREAIQEEFDKRTGNNASNDVGGKSVFKYS